MKKLYIKLCILLAVGISCAVAVISFLPGENKIKTSGAMESMDLWAMQRAYPEKIIPKAGHYKAFEYSKQNFTEESDNSFDIWTSIGPLNIGGRTLAIEVNPGNRETVYAGSASGGLWRSHTGGVGAQAWHNVPTGLPVLSVSSIAIPENDSNTIYIGTGEVYGYQNANIGMVNRLTRGSYGIGILKTTNNGNTWTKSLDWSYEQQRGVQVVRINPKNNNVIWAGTTEGTFVSYNAGTNWTQVNSTIMVTDIAINPVDTGTVFIACGNLGSTGLGVYRTTNSGNNWTQLTNGLPPFFQGKILLSMYKLSPNVLFASVGFGYLNSSTTQLCKTVDNGNTWTVASNDNYASYQGWYSHFVGVDPADSSNVIVGGIDILKSTNGGELFQTKSFWNIGYGGRVPIGGPEGPPSYSHADHHCITFDPYDPEVIYFGNDGGIFKSTDGGETFAGCNGGYQTTQFYTGFSSAVTDSVFAIGGMQDNLSAIFDGQQAWIRVIGGDGCWAGINRRSTDTLYGSSQFLNILASTNHGQSFYNISPPPGGNTAFVAPFVLGNVNPQIIYAGRSFIYKSENAGENWVIKNNGVAINGNNPVFTICLSKLNDDIVYAATAPFSSRSNIYKSDNGGTNWTNITGSLPDRFITDIATDHSNDNVVYCTVSGFGSPHVYLSSNGGAVWNDVTNGLPDVPTSSVIVDPFNSNHVYVGNDIGVYVSTNSGNEWSSFQHGMTDASIVMDLSISPLNKKLRAVTHGRGIYQRSLLSATVGINDPVSIANDFTLHQNYPNPFNPVTKIKFSIPSTQGNNNSNVKLSVYDLQGKEVEVLLNNKLGAGDHEIQFNGTGYSSGTYFYKLEYDGRVISRRMMLVK